MLSLQKIEQGLLFLTLLFLPTQLGRHFWPNFSFVFSLPIDYLSPVVYFWDLLVLLQLLVFLLQRKPVKKTPLNLYLLFFLTQVLSLTPFAASGSSVNLGAGLVRAEQHLVAGLFGVYLASVSWNFIKPAVFWALALSAISESALAISQFVNSGTLGLWIAGERTFSLSTPGIAKFDFYGRQFLRPYGTFPHPNVLAGFLVLANLLLSLKIFSLKSWIAKLSLILGGITILLSVSRTAIIAGIVLALLLLKSRGRIILLVIVLILLPILYTRFSAIFNFDSLSFIRREELSQASLEMWSSSKILGIGLNNFIPASSNQIVVGPSRFLQPVHNIFLLSLSETGLMGLTGFLILIGYPIIKLFKRPPFLMLWGIIIFLGMFDHYFLTLPQGYRMLFLIWGLTFSKED